MPRREIIIAPGGGLRRIGSRTLPTGKRAAIAAEEGGPSCCCGPGCSYYRAVLCNAQDCGGLDFPPVFFCIGDRCANDGPLIEPGMVIQPGFDQYCYRVEGTIYCPPIPRLSRLLAHIRALMGRGGRALPAAAVDCVPLPLDAIIIDPVAIACVPECTAANGCPKLEGWLPAVPCPCPGQTGNIPIVYIRCDAYTASLGLGLGACPVWSVGGYCFYVRPNSTPTRVCPPGAICTQAQASFASCCACCPRDAASGCCYVDAPIKTVEWRGRLGPITTVTGESSCCWLPGTYNATGSLQVFQEYICPDGSGRRCPVFQRVITFAGATRIVDDTYWNNGSGACPDPVLGCPGVSFHERRVEPITCASAESLITDYGSPGGGLASGLIRSRCDAATISLRLAPSEVNGTAGNTSTIQGSVSITGAGCGEANCAPALSDEHDQVPAGPRPAGTAGAGCAGCGTAAAATRL